MHTRRELLSSMLAAPLIRGAQTAPRPNIVFILMDDLRWDEIRCAGHPFVETPNIDRIAAEGVLFTRAYCGSPSCTPSRGAILTGQAVHRLENGGNLWSLLP